MPACMDCGKEALSKSNFAKSQLKKPSGKRRCLNCVEIEMKNKCKNNGDMPSLSSSSSSNTVSNTTLSGLSSACMWSQNKPGRTVVLQNIISDPSLNGKIGTIKKVLSNGRVAVEVIDIPGTVGTRYEKKRTISMLPEKLQVQPRIYLKKKSDECCPICLDTILDGPVNASQNQCCGKWICNKCMMKLRQRREFADKCPMCNSNLSNRSSMAVLNMAKARANRGDGNACFEVGMAYHVGSPGISINLNLSKVWFEKAVLLREVRAMHNLGCRYRDGEGDPIDLRLAAKYFKMAADGGDAYGACSYGKALLLGKGIGVDLVEGEKYIKASAEKGYEPAILLLKSFLQR